MRSILLQRRVGEPGLRPHDHPGDERLVEVADAEAVVRHVDEALERVQLGVAEVARDRAHGIEPPGVTRRRLELTGIEFGEPLRLRLAIVRYARVPEKSLRRLREESPRIE